MLLVTLNVATPSKSMPELSLKRNRVVGRSVGGAAAADADVDTVTGISLVGPTRVWCRSSCRPRVLVAPPRSWTPCVPFLLTGGWCFLRLALLLPIAGRGPAVDPDAAVRCTTAVEADGRWPWMVGVLAGLVDKDAALRVADVAGRWRQCR